MKRPSEKIVWDTMKTGYCKRLMPEFHRALGQYARNYESYKIGSTHDPDSRWPNYLKDGWLKMIIMYGSDSRDQAAEAEDSLIEYAKKASHKQKCWNVAPGSVGLARGHQKYYMYVLLDEY